MSQVIFEKIWLFLKPKPFCCRTETDETEWIPTPRPPSRRKRSETIYLSDQKQICEFIGENQLASIEDGNN
jgi:hypothetical protein